MNWLFPVVILVVIMAAGDGHRKGFIRKSVGLVSWIATFAITSISIPYITDFLKEETELYRVIQNTIAASDAEAIQFLAILGQAEALGGHVADMVLRVIAFLVTFVLLSVLVMGAATALGIAAKLPVINGFNKTAGMMLGFAEGLLLVWIFFFVVTVFVSSEWGVKVLLMISENEILSWIYQHNLLFLFLQM